MEITKATPNSTVVPEITVEPADDYTAAIELSNACREFYRSRVKKTESFKQSMNSRNNDVTMRPGRRTTIDDAMDKLRTEMASLMDQDNSLMKQLLTLNEAIEELKTKRLYHVSKDSLPASSQDLHASDWSFSETDMFESDDDNDAKLTDAQNRIQLSSISLPVPLTRESEFNTRMGNLGLQRRSDIAIKVHTPLNFHKSKHAPQSSLDSGYGDDVHFNKHARGPMEVTF